MHQGEAYMDYGMSNSIDTTTTTLQPHREPHNSSNVVRKVYSLSYYSSFYKR